ncbi:MAG: hypothetical protein ACTSRA_05745 [Promethearchaeota archaeon]
MTSRTYRALHAHANFLGKNTLLSAIIWQLGMYYLFLWGSAGSGIDKG